MRKPDITWLDGCSPADVTKYRIVVSPRSLSPQTAQNTPRYPRASRRYRPRAREALSAVLVRGG